MKRSIRKKSHVLWLTKPTVFTIWPFMGKSLLDSLYSYAKMQEFNLPVTQHANCQEQMMMAFTWVVVRRSHAISLVSTHLSPTRHCKSQLLLSSKSETYTERD